MITIKNNKIRVRCTESNTLNFKSIGTETIKRTSGLETEYIFRSNKKCSNCSEKMEMMKTVVEYPEDILNYIETNTENCLVMEDFTEYLDSNKINLYYEK